MPQYLASYSFKISKIALTGLLNHQLSVISIHPGQDFGGEVFLTQITGTYAITGDHQPGLARVLVPLLPWIHIYAFLTMERPHTSTDWSAIERF